MPVDSAKWLITSDCVMRFLPAALVAIVWCNTSNENLDLKSKTDTHISHSSSKVFKKAAFPRGFLKETHHWPTNHGSRQSKRLLMIQIETHFTAKPSKCQFFRGMVGARGFEPPTSRSQTERTTRLCYAPIPRESQEKRLPQGQHHKSRESDGQAHPVFAHKNSLIAWIALARWLIWFLIASESSPKVSLNPSGTNRGSYPKPPLPRSSNRIFP